MGERNDPLYLPRHKRIKFVTYDSIYAKYALLYTLCYTVMFAIGCLLFHMVGSTSTVFDRRIVGCFSADFSDCSDAFTFADRLLALSAQELIRLGLTFMAGFTIFASLALGGILMVRGFYFGFAVSYLTSFIRKAPHLLSHPTRSLLLFSCLGAFCAALMIHLSVRTVMFSDAFRSLGGRPRLILRSRALYAQILRFITAFGAILLLTLLRCALL